MEILQIIHSFPTATALLVMTLLAWMGIVALVMKSMSEVAAVRRHRSADTLFAGMGRNIATTARRSSERLPDQR